MTAPDILGDSPGKYRVGVLALANDQVIERDLTRILPDDLLTYTTRIAFGGDCTLEQLAKMAPTLTGATGLLNPEVALDAVVFGCSSGTIAIGADQIASAVQKVLPNTVVINPIDAACAAFKRLGAKRINLLTPYEPEIAELMALAFIQRGIEIVHRHDFGIVDSADISRVKPEAIRDAAVAMGSENADAIFLSCTDFQSLYVLDDIERQTGLPAVSSNQAMAWQILEHSRFPSKNRRFGRLLHLKKQDNI